MNQELFNKVESLQNLLIDCATGVVIEDDTEQNFKKLRSELINNELISSLLPTYINSSRNLIQFWHYISTISSTYKERRIIIWDNFSEVFNYKNSKDVFGDYITSEKKALVVVNADVTIAYDLSKIEFEVDESTKTLTILGIPEDEVKISPDFEYYDIQADFFNPFEAKDYNAIELPIYPNPELENPISHLIFDKKGKLSVPNAPGPDSDNIRSFLNELLVE